jgi:flagellar basal body-associated protein FliL
MQQGRDAAEALVAYTTATKEEETESVDRGHGRTIGPLFVSIPMLTVSAVDHEQRSVRIASVGYRVKDRTSAA